MKLKIWIGPLIVVIILFTLRQMLNNSMQNEKQQSAIHEIKRPPVLNLPMAGTHLLTDTLPF